MKQQGHESDVYQKEDCFTKIQKFNPENSTLILQSRDNISDCHFCLQQIIDNQQCQQQLNVNCVIQYTISNQQRESSRALQPLNNIVIFQQITVQNLDYVANVQARQQTILYKLAKKTRNLIQKISIWLNNFQTRHLVPTIPLSQYKRYLEYFLFFQSLFELFLNFDSIICAWTLWYMFLGIWRFKNIGIIRFVAQFSYLIIWITINVSVFSPQNRQKHIKLFQAFLLLINIDYYFLGSGNMLTFLYWVFLTIYTTLLNYRLSQIKKKLNKKRQKMLKQLLSKISQNQEVVLQDQNCSICLQQNKIQMVILNCGHFYHLQCIKIWIQSNNSCPVCRAILY